MMAFKSFMHGIIDYAGMFPPANLELPPAFSNYLDYINSDDEWMMDKFVCSMKSFEELADTNSDVYKLLQDYDSKRPVSFSLLLTGGKTAKEFLKSLEEELKFVKNFTDNNTNTEANSFEVKLPGELFEEHNTNGLKTFLNSCCNILNGIDMSESIIFLEPAVNDNFEFLFEKLAHTSAEIENQGRFGFKLEQAGLLLNYILQPSRLHLL